VSLRVALVAVAVAVAAACLTGCGSARVPDDRIRGKTLTIYFSGPLRGASAAGAQAALNGARLALAQVHGRVGSDRIAFKALDDSTAQSDGWDPSQTTANARLAAQDPTTIGYLGEFNSGASAIAIPLLNRAGIAQISPASTAVGLTSAGPGASPGEPQKYYPAGARTFARVVPSDAIEAAALVRLQQTMGCRTAFVLQDGEVDGEDLALTFVLTAQSAGLRVLGVQVFEREATDYSSLVRSVGQSGAGCVLISAIDESSAAVLTRQLARTLPAATIFASNGLADSSYTDPAHGGIPLSLDPRVVIASATLDAAAYPATGQAFLAAYSRRFGAPQPPAIFGYAAMSLMLGAIARATDRGDEPADRSKVVSAVLSGGRRQSVLGSFRVDSVGDTTIDRYGIHRIVAGRLSFLQVGG
jgi:branched-chain amino acid transport system substrate-binding protein